MPGMDVRRRVHPRIAAALATASLLAACTATSGDRVSVWVGDDCGESDPLSCDVLALRVTG